MRAGEVRGPPPPQATLDADPCLGQFASKETHLQCQEQALFAGHRPLNSKLHGLRLQACVGDRHHTNIITEGKDRRLLPDRTKISIYQFNCTNYPCVV